jgi:hypothetical protein
MAREGTSVLDNGDIFPDITFPGVDREPVVLPRDFNGKWGVFLVYRGHW